MNRYTTGWWCIPGNQSNDGFTKVHLEIDGLPACGCRIRPAMEYQWCANGIRFDYLECVHCKKIAKKTMCDYCERITKNVG